MFRPKQVVRWGDERSIPENIIRDARQTKTIAITDRESGRIVWQIGPDYDTGPEVKELGWIIGQHRAYMIPRGLPREGNILVFDNGVAAGLGSPNPSSPTGYNNNAAIDNVVNRYRAAALFAP